MSTQQGNRVHLDQATETVGARLVPDIQPEEWHGTDITAHPLFQIGLRTPDIGDGRVKQGGGSAQAIAFTPRARQGGLSAGQRRTNEEAENRTAMIPARSLDWTAVLTQPLPQRALRSKPQCVRANTHDPAAPARSGPFFAGFEEKIDSALRPVHQTIALRQCPGTTETPPKAIEQFVETNYIGETIRHGVAIIIHTSCSLGRRPPWERLPRIRDVPLRVQGTSGRPRRPGSGSNPSRRCGVSLRRT